MLKVKALFIAVPLIVLAVMGGTAGCGVSQDVGAWLEDCGQAAADYARADGYLHFVQEKDFRLAIEGRDFEQELRVEGDIIFPGRQSYEYLEKSRSSLQPEETQENAFSYLTLDGGETAYVSGRRLSEELGVAGWVQYTPQPDQNRYFDYADLMESLTAPGGEMEWLGFEDSGGERCAHVRYSISGQELIDLRLQQDPSLLEEYEGIDVGGIVGELSLDMWIGEVDKLPRQVKMEQVATLEDGSNSATTLLMVFSGYGEEPRVLIEAPAFFTEAV